MSGEHELPMRRLLGCVAHLLDRLSRHKVLPLLSVTADIEARQLAGTHSHVQLEDDSLYGPELVELRAHASSEKSARQGQGCCRPCLPA